MNIENKKKDYWHRKYGPWIFFPCLIVIAIIFTIWQTGIFKYYPIRIIEIRKISSDMFSIKLDIDIPSNCQLTEFGIKAQERTKKDAISRNEQIGVFMIPSQNNISDKITLAKICSYRIELPNMRYIFEPFAIYHTIQKDNSISKTIEYGKKIIVQ